MRTAAKIFAVILGWASVACAAEPGTLTTLHAVHSLTKAEAARGNPVAFEATVTYYNRNDIDLFVQDGDEAVYVETKPQLDIVPGDRVLIRGTTRGSFRPDIAQGTVERLHAGVLPKPAKAGFAQLIHAQLDAMRVTVRGTVRSADNVIYDTLPAIDIKLLVDGGYIDVAVIRTGNSDLRPWLDAEVEVTGVAAGRFDKKDQMTGVVLEALSLDDIKILKQATTRPDSLPVTPMDEVLSANFLEDRTSRVRVQGTITYYQPGSAVVLENGSKSLWVMTQYEGALQVGDWADATGFPEVNSGQLTLTRAEIQDSQIAAPIASRTVTGADLASGVHAFDLVTLEGQVLTAAREAAQDEYVMVADGKVFSAILRHPEVTGADLTPMKRVEVGSTVRATGICTLQYGSDPFHGPVSVNILMRNADDLTLVASPSLVNTRNLGVAAALLFLLVLAAGVRGWVLERRVRRQTAELAYIERRRSRILEDINGSRPLAEIVEQVTELVSFKLKGAPCWCRIAEGAQLGNCPAKLDAFRVIHAEIPSRSGLALGTLFAALDPLTTPQPIEGEALTMAAALCALATETRHIYSDLRRRSEFDLLTDTHNRFSLDKHLESLMQETRQNAGIFGLIYIDLNQFKQINDLFGHQVGDRYLQEVALRMKRQLRSHDLLARLGGDEFAALVPVVRSRAEVEEIAQRLERSFDEPFAIDHCMIQGSASVGIALYPEDGNTKDTLFGHADAAMYVAKNSARGLE